MEECSALEAGSVVPPGRRIPTRELWGGNPVEFRRKLTDEEIMTIEQKAARTNALCEDVHQYEFIPPYGTAWRDLEETEESSRNQ